MTLKLILKSSPADGFANKPGYALSGNPPRWHKTGHSGAAAAASGQPEPSGKQTPAQTSTSPQGAAQASSAGTPVTLSDDQLAQMKAVINPDNVNAKTFNKQLSALLDLGKAGNIDGILQASFGSNTYAKRLVLVANFLLSQMGSDQQVSPGQKANSHPSLSGGAVTTSAASDTKNSPVDAKNEPFDSQNAPKNAEIDPSVPEPSIPETSDDSLSAASVDTVVPPAKKAKKQPALKPADDVLPVALTDDGKEFAVSPIAKLAPTDKTFASMKDVFNFDVEQKFKLQDQLIEGTKQLGIHDIPLADLKTMQTMVDKKAVTDMAKDFSLEKYKNDDDPARVLQMPDGSFVLWGGNHRVSAAMLSGIKSLPFTVTAVGKNAESATFAGKAEKGQTGAAASKSPSGVVLGDDGKPMMFYHGGADVGTDKLSPLTFFTTDKAVAQSYQKASQGDSGGKVNAVNLKLSNPAKDADIVAAAKETGLYEEHVNPHQFLTESMYGDDAIKVMNELKAQGFDGAVMTDMPVDGGDLIESYVVFSSGQVVDANGAEGSQDGKTKQGADGLLVLKDGHWEKANKDQPSEKSPTQAEEKPKQKQAAKKQPDESAKKPEKVGSAGSVKITPEIEANLNQIPVFDMSLPDTNVNAKTINAKIGAIWDAATNGNVNAILAMSFGSNNYAKKLVLLANTCLAALGSDQSVSMKQKANSHPALSGGSPAPAATPTPATATEAKPSQPAPAKPKAEKKPKIVKKAPPAPEPSKDDYSGLTGDALKDASAKATNAVADHLGKTEKGAYFFSGMSEMDLISGVYGAMDFEQAMKFSLAIKNAVINGMEPHEAFNALGSAKTAKGDAMIFSQPGKDTVYLYKDKDPVAYEKVHSFWKGTDDFEPPMPKKTVKASEQIHTEKTLNDTIADAVSAFDAEFKETSDPDINAVMSSLSYFHGLSPVSSQLNMINKYIKFGAVGSGEMEFDTGTGTPIIINAFYHPKLYGKLSALKDAAESFENKIPVKNDIIKDGATGTVNGEFSVWFDGKWNQSPKIRPVADPMVGASTLSTFESDPFPELWDQGLVSMAVEEVEHNDDVMMNLSVIHSVVDPEIVGEPDDGDYNEKASSILEWLEKDPKTGAFKMSHASPNPVTINADDTPALWELLDKTFTAASQIVNASGGPSAAETGPKDGDMKPGADGMLILKNGHWVKMNKDQAIPADTVIENLDISQAELQSLYPGLDLADMEAEIDKNPDLEDEMMSLSMMVTMDDEIGSDYASAGEALKAVLDSLKLDENGDILSTLAYEKPKLIKASEYPVFHEALVHALTQAQNLVAMKVKDKNATPSGGTVSDGLSENSGFHLTNTQEGHNKFWQVWSDGKMVYTKYGKIGSAGTTSGKEINSTNMPKGADEYIMKLMASKIKKGYVATGKSIPVASVAAGKKAQSPTPKTADISGIPVSGTGVTNMDSWTQIGPQGGSNPGGKFEDPLGGEWYCKFPGDMNVAKSEILAANLYALAGVEAQKAVLIKKGGKLGIASQWTDVTKATPAKLAKASGALDGFAVDAWLGNWDVIGLNFDNLMIDKDGKAVRIDAGGSLEYRAQGEKKPFGNEVTEIASLRDPAVNAQAAKVFGKITDADLNASVLKVLKIPDSDIIKLVNDSGIGDKAHREKLAQTLIARKKDLAKKFPKAAKMAAKASFDPSKISAPPDFLNWSGPGQSGPSSKQFLNQANHDAAEAIYKLAKKGDIEGIKKLQANVFNKDNGAVVGAQSVLSHPSQHIKGYAQQAINEIEYQSEKSYLGRVGIKGSLAAYAAKFPKVTGPSSKNAEKLGKYLLLGKTTGSASSLSPEQFGIKPSTLTKGQQKEKMTSLASAAWAKMPNTQKQAIKSYTGNGYSSINSGLWAGNPSGKALAAAEGLHTLSHYIPEGMKLSRKINLDESLAEQLLKSVGSVIQEPAIMSTSVSPAVFSGNVQLKMHVGPGVKGLWVGPGSAGAGGAISMHSGEQEVVIPPGCRMLVTKATKGGGADEDGFGYSNYLIECIILPND